MVNEKDIKAWYDQKHRSLKENAWRPFEAYPVILDYLAVKKGESLLDVGCGTGYLMQAANKRRLKTYGVDISEEAVKIAKNIAPDSHVNIGKGESIKFSSNSFDYVVCLGALEHFLDMSKGIQEMKRVGKNDALFCILVPNSDFLFWKIRGYKGTEQREINENLLSLNEWKSFFVSHDLEILRIHKDQWQMKNKKFFTSANPVEIIQKLLYKVAWFSLPLKYTYQFIFILK